MQPRPEVPSSGSEALIRSYMTSPAQVLPSGSSLADAYELMQRRGIRHVPVVDGKERLVGVLSDREAYLAKEERGVDVEDVTVDELMTRSPYAVGPDARLADVAATMANRKYGCTVVVDAGRVV